MIPPDDPLWAEFAAESEEHLDTLDRLLSAGGAPDDVNRLFRAMHSLKGMSAALRAGGMLRLAHAAEDVLGLVRAGRLALDPAAGDALRAAVDALRRQRAVLVGGAGDPPAPVAVLDRLAGLVASPTAIADPPALAFARRMAEAAPGLSGDSAVALADLARTAGLGGIATRLADFAAAAGTPGALPALGLLRRALSVLEETCGAPAGLAETAADPGLLPARLAPVLTLLPAALADPPAQAAAILPLLHEAAACAAACADDPAETTLLGLLDLFARNGEADVVAEGAVLAARLGAQGPVAPVATMRVRQDTIDGIIALEAEVRAGALAVAEAIGDAGARSDLARLGVLGQRLPAGPAREAAAATDRLRRFLDALEGAEQRLGLALRRLDDAVLDLRVVPIGTLYARLPRAIRALADAGGKQVDLAMEGEEVALDRSLVELLADPLLHLARNAVDHGVEPAAARLAAGKPARATLRIAATRHAGQVRLRVSDDGRGIDVGRVLARGVEQGLMTAAEAAVASDDDAHALLFNPGFSTAGVVTETSGRGVGLDVVRDAVRRAGGSLEVSSTPGQGAAFTLRLPLTAALAPVLLVMAGGQPCALPEGRVDGVATPEACPVPVIDLAAALGLAPQGPGGIVLATVRGRRIGLRVDRVLRRTDLLLRPLHPMLAALPGVAGVGLLGNGEPVLVIDPDGITPA
ncbi:chemotaxis protein CheA [Humitalea sp. 24SJ18S-53]|uniref:chemotaxis protein CheA n=1 Tax=Humitalea sp. 24SJ18S-53 TaxID=3422307 RepID=UPI003D667A39